MEKVNFAKFECRAHVESEFRYYRILPIIEWELLLKLRHLNNFNTARESTFRLFEMKFARTLPIEVWEANKDKPSLLDKWTSICASYIYSTKPLQL